MICFSECMDLDKFRVWSGYQYTYCPIVWNITCIALFLGPTALATLCTDYSVSSEIIMRHCFQTNLQKTSQSLCDSTIKALTITHICHVYTYMAQYLYRPTLEFLYKENDIFQGDTNCALCDHILSTNALSAVYMILAEFLYIFSLPSISYHLFHFILGKYWVLLHDTHYTEVYLVWAPKPLR